MSNRGVFVAGVGAASIAALIVVRSRRSLYNSLAGSILAPRLDKRPYYVSFGKVSGQNRGPNPMTPTLYLKDPYFYVRDESRKNVKVLNHLRKENAYTDKKTKHLKGVRETLYHEMLSHVQETDEEYPFRHGPYLYYRRVVKGSSYVIHCRKPRSGNGREEILLDENELAKGKKFIHVTSVNVSPDHKFLSYMLDDSGMEVYTGFIKNIRTGKLLPDRLPGIRSLVWGGNSSVLFYTTPNKVLRTDKVWRYNVGQSSSGKSEIYTDNDPLYYVSIFKSRSSRFLFIVSESSETSEISFIDLEKPTNKLQSIALRQKGVLYSVDHQDKYFYIVTNKDKATNFKMMRTLVSSPGQEHWQDVFPYDESVKIDDIDAFKDFLIISGRQNGFSQLWIVKHESDGDHGTKYKKERIVFNEAIHTLYLGVNEEFDTSKFRFIYSSFTTPRMTYDYDVNTDEKILLKEQNVPNYDRSLYKAERLIASAADGVEVPISIIYRKDLRVKDRQALHLYGYGSYGHSIDPEFRSSILPLLDRGVIFAVAHIRGGGEMGRTWYENAKYKMKCNTFTDFISCAEHLIKVGITSSSMMTCEGRSAGGLLIGAVLNMRPDLFTGALLKVPFVDVLNTMSDASIPGTTAEWEEWGNPNEKSYFDYMLTYSPYENIKQQSYPNILVTSGLYDPRVMYWEPTKYVAKLRDLKCDRNDVLLKTDLTSGHFSTNDRYAALKEGAFDVAFILEQLKCIREKDTKAVAIA